MIFLVGFSDAEVTDTIPLDDKLERCPKLSVYSPGFADLAGDLGLAEGVE